MRPAPPTPSIPSLPSQVAITPTAASIKNKFLGVSVDGTVFTACPDARPAIVATADTPADINEALGAAFQQYPTGGGLGTVTVTYGLADSGRIDVTTADSQIFTYAVTAVSRVTASAARPAHTTLPRTASTQALTSLAVL